MTAVQAELGRGTLWVFAASGSRQLKHDHTRLRSCEIVRRQKNAVLLLAHGSPDSVDDIPEFLNQITRGRPVRRR